MQIQDSELSFNTLTACEHSNETVTLMNFIISVTSSPKKCNILHDYNPQIYAYIIGPEHLSSKEKENGTFLLLNNNCLPAEESEEACKEGDTEHHHK